MKVIFIKDLKKVANKNDIKEVSDGYGINFLIKNGYAVKYSKTSSNILNEQMQDYAEREANRIKEAKDIKNKLEQENITFDIKLGNSGKMFGSITNKQISDKLKELGYNISKKDVNFKNEKQVLGSNYVEITLFKDVIANINIKLINKK